MLGRCPACLLYFYCSSSASLHVKRTKFVCIYESPSSETFKPLFPCVGELSWATHSRRQAHASADTVSLACFCILPYVQVTKDVSAQFAELNDPNFTVSVQPASM